MIQPSLHGFFASIQKSSDKWALYLDVYEELFAPFRDQSISILEIGIQNGGFLEVLAAYFPNAVRIVGCDIDEKCGSLAFSDPRISVVIGDASSVDTVNRIKAVSNDFDIVIDDGSHRSKDIVTAFCHYFPLIRENGVFIAEDLHCSYWYEYEGGLAHQFSSMNFFKLLTDIVNYEHWGLSQPRKRLLADMLNHHGCAIDDDELEKVFSVQFCNSMSVVRKKAGFAVLLGQRVVSGSRSAVADNASLNGSGAMRNDQHGNPFSDLDLISNKHVFGLFADILNVNSTLSADHEKLTDQAASMTARIEEQKNELRAVMEQFAILRSSIEELQKNDENQKELLGQFAVLRSGIDDLKSRKTFFDWLRAKLRSRGG